MMTGYHVGAVLTALLGILVVESYGWQWMFVLGSLPALVLAHGTAPMKAKVDALAASLGTTFAADDASCRRCHPQGIAIVDHGPLFPLPHQDKAGTTVASVQVAQARWRTPASSVRATHRLHCSTPW